MSAGRIESVRIRGFRSLADVELSNLQNANVLIGANGSGKSNFIRFFEMMSWMLRSRRLGEFVALHGDADDQLYGGNSVTPRMEGELALRTDKGRNDYCFTLAYAQPDRFIFTQEAYRFSAAHYPTDAHWWASKIELSEKFFQEIIQHPVPIDMNTLTALKRCALGLDLYLWLVYRTFALRAPQRLTWRQLYCQFEADPDKASDKQTIKFFRRKVLRELKKIKISWPGLNYTTAPGVLILHPSTPAIAPLDQAQLGS